MSIEETENPCTCIGGSQGEEAGGAEWNQSLEPADPSVAGVGRSPSFTQGISPKHVIWVCILHFHFFFRHLRLLLNEAGKSYTEYFVSRYDIPPVLQKKLHTRQPQTYLLGSHSV